MIRPNLCLCDSFVRRMLFQKANGLQLVLQATRVWLSGGVEDGGLQVIFD